MNSAVLTAAQLRKSYGSTHALDGVSLSIHRGESLAIMGPSGSGKSTLLHVLAGIAAHDSGEVTFHSATGEQVDVTGLGETARSRLRRERFGFVFQQGLLIPELTAVENVALAAMINGVRRPDAQNRAAACLQALGLGGMEERRIGELSGGQAQRVAIARAQMNEAELVFADEPTGSVDSHTSVEVMDALLWSTTGQGRTLVVVTHDAGVAARCTRTIMVRDGQIISATVNA